MKLQYLLVSLIIMMVFSGGFLAGIQYTNNKSQQMAENMKKEQITAEKEKESQEPLTLPEQESQTKAAQAKVLMGYVQDFRNPDIVDYENLTHVIFSFAHPLKDGTVLLNGDTALENFRTMILKAHEQDTKVYLAIGGWYHIQGGESYPYFQEAISNPISRSKLVTELEGIASRENLDGIDIDFEHPRTAEDAQNLATFTHELSERLHHQDKELSIAVNAKVHSVAGTEINNVIYEPAMFKDVDYVNIMAYDGQWDGEYNAANLAPYHHIENIVHYWSNLFESQQISKEKLILGTPFYAQPEDPNIKQISYAAIINQNPEHAGQDTIVMNGTTYHYNGVNTVQRKTKLAIDNGFGGMMLWESGHDSAGDYSLTAAIAESLDERQSYTLQSES